MYIYIYNKKDNSKKDLRTMHFKESMSYSNPLFLKSNIVKLQIKLK